mgnify:CR=1 FL=1
MSLFESQIANKMTVSSKPHTVAQQREKNQMRHQAVFSIDYSTWQRLIQAFNITEPLIPHRGATGGGGAIGARGWYNG